MRLMDLDNKDNGVVTEILAGRRATARLMEMGLTIGEEFIVVSKLTGGPIEIRVRGTDLAIGFELAEKVIVKLIGDSK
jgi:Fe2+ transport system protein FeoA